MSNALITVEIAYATAEKQLIILLELPEASDIETAIHASGILQQFPEIDLRVNKVGIFGKVSKLDKNLRHLDRVEIYRALIADPKIARRKRAATQNLTKKNG